MQQQHRNSSGLCLANEQHPVAGPQHTNTPGLTRLCSVLSSSRHALWPACELTMNCTPAHACVPVCAGL